MERRSFFKALFGASALLVVKPALAESSQAVAPISSLPLPPNETCCRASNAYGQGIKWDTIQPGRALTWEELKELANIR